MKRTYTPWQDWKNPSAQKEYKEPTKMLSEDGTLLAAGWARHNVFDYDRFSVKHPMRRKEWVSMAQELVILSNLKIQVSVFAI